jgi:CheY-like chemotaxis protein
MSNFGSLGRPAEILLIEDNPHDVKLTELAFDEIDVDHRFHVACDGQQAMSFLRREGDFSEAVRPDLILLDLNMPIKDGRAVLEEVKQDADLRRIPLIVLTTSDSADDRMLAYNQHANAYLVKPMDIDEWNEMVGGISLFWLTLVRHPPTVPGSSVPEQ